MRQRSDRAPVAAIIAAMGVSTGGMLPVSMIGPLSVQIRRDLDLGTARLGAAVAIYFLSAAAQSIRIGQWCDHIGPGRGVLIASTSSVASLLAIAAFARSYVLLLVFLLVGTLAASLSTPATNGLVLHNIDAARQGVAHGAKQAAIPLAVLIGGAAVPTAASAIGWRWAFVLAAIVPAIGGLSALLSVESPAHASPAERSRPHMRQQLREFDAIPLVLMAVGAGLSGASVTSLTTFSVDASRETGISEGHAGALLAVASAVVVIVRVSAGRLADRRLGDRFVPIITMLFLSVSGFVLLAIETESTNAIGTVLALVAGWGWTGLFTLLVVEQHPRHGGVATGVAMTFIYGGGVVGPFLFGQMVDAGSYRVAWLYAGGLSFSAGTLMLLSRRSLGRNRHAAG
jgi:predicted MFS family arabinose efflux permease